MDELICISDFNSENHNQGKILYILSEDEITSYFYSNQANLSNDEIEAQLAEILDMKDLPWVGNISVAEQAWLEYIEVREPYRKRGIGSTLIKLAIEHLCLSCIACVQECASYVYSLTPAGENLIAYCINAGIVTPNMCCFSADDVPLEEDASEDPGYDSWIVKSCLPKQLEWDEEQENRLDEEGPEMMRAFHAAGDTQSREPRLYLPTLFSHSLAPIDKEEPHNLPLADEIAENYNNFTK